MHTIKSGANGPVSRDHGKIRNNKNKELFTILFNVKIIS